MTRRKYDTPAYRATRKRLGQLVRMGGAICWRCRNPIAQGSRWHVGHDDAGVAIMGPEHAACNLRAAGKARARQLYGDPSASEAPPIQSRKW